MFLYVSSTLLGVYEKDEFDDVLKVISKVYSETKIDFDYFSGYNYKVMGLVIFKINSVSI